jgi:hypothetical protein
MATNEKSSDAAVPASQGTNEAISGAFGFLGGTEPQFKQHAGVYGESDQLGVTGHAGDGGTGVFGNNKGLGFGVRGETVDGNAGVQGECFGNGDGVKGISAEGAGVAGRNTSTVSSRAGVTGQSSVGPGVEGFSVNGRGVEGHANRGDVDVSGFLGGTDPVFNQHVGVFGTSDQQGVMGVADTGTGAFGRGSIGVRGETTNGDRGFLAGRDPFFKQDAGVYGESAQQGVMGLCTSTSGTGVFGGSTPASGGGGIGVRGETVSGVGVQGQSFGAGIGVNGGSTSGDGVRAHSGSGNGLSAFSDTGTAIFAKGPVNAGFFDGNVTVTGDVLHNRNLTVIGDILLTGADCAEHFDIAGAEQIDPGTVVVIDREGALRASQGAYDKKVAGVVSGAGKYRPGLILDKQQSAGRRLPVALVGKVYCKVDARYSPIEVGDLLTTSPTPGHAMKASDPLRALGTLIGKALSDLADGQGLIPILVALQ